MAYRVERSHPAKGSRTYRFALALVGACCAIACGVNHVRCEHESCLAAGDDDATADDDATQVGPFAFGPLAVDASGAEVVFALPADLSSFTLTASAPSPADARLGFHALSAPDGVVLYAIGDDTSLNPAFDPYPGAASIMVPTSDDAAAQPTAGRYRARLGLFTLADDGSFIPTSGEIGQASITTKTMDERGGTLTLRIAITDTAAFPAMGEVLDEVRRLYALADIALAEPIFATLPDSIDTLDDSDAARAACAAHAEGTAVNVLIVSNVGFAGGIAGGVPGPPGVAHTAASCVVIAKQASAQATGALMAHEVGHFLGLFHTTRLNFDASANEYKLQGYDALSDTAECQRGTPLENCPDYQNLMFPFFPTSGLTLTPAQIEIIRRSPWLVPREGG